jgi:hypothetical protein
MSKTKYRLKNVANSATYYTGKFAVAPVVAVVDTTVAAGQATVALTKGLGQAALHIVKAPLSGVARGNEFYKNKFAFNYQVKRDLNRKLASGEFVEVIVPAETEEVNA